MELNTKTNLHDLLTQYPFVKDFLISQSSEFKMLNNPILRNTVVRIATLGKVASLHKMDLRKLLEDIASEIKNKTGDIVSVSSVDNIKD